MLIDAEAPSITAAPSLSFKSHSELFEQCCSPVQFWTGHEACMCVHIHKCIYMMSMPKCYSSICISPQNEVHTVILGFKADAYRAARKVLILWSNINKQEEISHRCYDLSCLLYMTKKKYKYSAKRRETKMKNT